MNKLTSTLLFASMLTIAVLYRPACAQSVQALPRTSSGRPNLQGAWSLVRSPADGPVPDNAAARGARSVFAGMAYLANALQKKSEIAAKTHDESLFWCVTASVPAAILFMPFPFLI